MPHSVYIVKHFSDLAVTRLIVACEVLRLNLNCGCCVGLFIMKVG